MLQNQSLHKCWEVKMKIFVMTLLTFILAQSVYANSGGAEVAVPWGHIRAQLINVIILIGLLIYFLREPVKQVFKSRLADYLEEFKKAENTKTAAEAEKKSWIERMSKLEKTSQESLDRAQKESAEQGQRLVLETQEKAKQLLIDAEKTIELEVQKSKDLLQKELLTDSLAEARDKLKDKMDQLQQKKLNNEFFDKIKTVQQ